MIVKTPPPPYYAVIFTSIRTEVNEGYQEMNDFLTGLAKKEKGFLGQDACRDEIGIAVSYWDSLEAIQRWRANTSHKVAKDRGKKEWYESHNTRIAKVEREY